MWVFLKKLVKLVMKITLFAEENLKIIFKDIFFLECK
jgi:hypothetical protein